MKEKLQLWSYGKVSELDLKCCLLNQILISDKLQFLKSTFSGVFIDFKSDHSIQFVEL